MHNADPMHKFLNKLDGWTILSITPELGSLTIQLGQDELEIELYISRNLHKPEFLSVTISEQFDV